MMLLNQREYPQIENLRTYERIVGPIGLPAGAVLVVLIPLAFLGASLSLRSHATARWLASALAVQILVLLPFFVTDRYRMHIIPLLLLLGAIGGKHLVVDRFRSAPIVTFSRANVVALLIGLIAVLYPLPGVSLEREDWGIAMDLGERAVRKGQYAAASVHLADAARIENRSARRWEASPSMSVPLTGHALLYAEALEKTAYPVEARAWLARAERLSPGVTAGGSRAKPGVESPLPAGAANSELRERAIVAARSGRFAEAEEMFSRLAAPSVSDSYAWGALIRLAARDARVERARRVLSHADSCGWRGTARDAHAALLIVLEGRWSEAANATRALPEDEIESDPTLKDVRRVILSRSTAIAAPRRSAP